MVSEKMYNNIDHKWRDKKGFRDIFSRREKKRTQNLMARISSKNEPQKNTKRGRGRTKRGDLGRPHKWWEAEARTGNTPDAWSKEDMCKVIL